MAEMWQLLDEAGVDLVLAGHEHSYERFVPQTHDGQARAEGLLQIIVGTGGRNLRPLTARQPNSQVFNGDHFGVLELKLFGSSYSWRFVPISGSFSDSGSQDCR
jgi:alkaline phosphatase